ncbi:UNVERIFIED_CONTAM: hypothetical protein HHA_278780 [Hammondia hammondi]|eukprot:XP_008887149.1 hypothetical protein HHA_278780 [Hammondia hammondi]
MALGARRSGRSMAARVTLYPSEVSADEKETEHTLEVSADQEAEDDFCPHSTSIDTFLKWIGKDLGLDADGVEDIRARLLVNHITTGEALEAAVREQRLCGLFHPRVTEAIVARVTGRALPMFDLDEFMETRLRVKNPAKFAHGAIFVHRIAPVPGTRKGRIAVTWAFDLDLETTTVAELLQRLELLVGDVPVDRMRLVFNGFSMATTSSLQSYDVRSGDTLFLYTLRDPQTQVTFTGTPQVLTTPQPVHAPLPVGLAPAAAPVRAPLPMALLCAPNACAPSCGAGAQMPGFPVSPGAAQTQEQRSETLQAGVGEPAMAAPGSAFLTTPSTGAHVVSSQVSAPQIFAPQVAAPVLSAVGGAVLTPAVCPSMYGYVAPGAQLAVGAGGYGDPCLVAQPIDRRVETCKCGSYTAFRYPAPGTRVTTCGSCPVNHQQTSS